MSINTLETSKTTSDSTEGIYSKEPVNYAEAAARYAQEAQKLRDDPKVNHVEVTAKQDTADYLKRRAEEIASIGDKALTAANPSEKE